MHSLRGLHTLVKKRHILHTRALALIRWRLSSDTIWNHGSLNYGWFVKPGFSSQMITEAPFCFDGEEVRIVSDLNQEVFICAAGGTVVNHKWFTTQLQILTSYCGLRDPNKAHWVYWTYDLFWRLNCTCFSLLLGQWRWVNTPGCFYRTLENFSPSLRSTCNYKWPGPVQQAYSLFTAKASSNIQAKPYLWNPQLPLKASSIIFISSPSLTYHWICWDAWPGKQCQWAGRWMV